MSGRKRSTVVLERDREEKIRLISEIGNEKGRLAGFVAKVEDLLQRTPEGVRKTFGKEVSEALEWLRDAGHQETGRLTVDSGISTLRSAQSRLNGLADKGVAMLDILTVSFTQKADAMEKALTSRLSQLEGIYAGGKALLETWATRDSLKECENALNVARQYLKERRLQELGQYLENTRKRLDAMNQEARELEHKHQKRNYILKSLRQVCYDMGFKESEPYYEKQNKKNPIVYEVDTHDQGKIRFFLSLDGISTDSEIMEDRCLDEFDKLSRHLEEEFGVKTRFQVEGEKPDERLIHKGEIDQPEGSYKEKSA
jgi:flagellar biosynthesis/type III secretory pathway chaperone